MENPAPTVHSVVHYLHHVGNFYSDVAQLQLPSAGSHYSWFRGANKINKQLERSPDVIGLQEVKMKRWVVSFFCANV